MRPSGFGGGAASSTRAAAAAAPPGLGRGGRPSLSFRGVPGGVLEWEAEGEERLPRHDGHVADWLQCIRDRSTPICDVEVGARSAAICHLMNIAYWHREEVTWDPEAWRFEEEGANAWVDYSRRSGYGLPGF